MSHEIFDGHLTQIDYRNKTVHRLHLLGNDGRRLLVTIEDPAVEEFLVPPSDGSLPFFNRDNRNPVTIEEAL